MRYRTPKLWIGVYFGSMILLGYQFWNVPAFSSSGRYSCFIAPAQRVKLD